MTSEEKVKLIFPKAELGQGNKPKGGEYYFVKLADGSKLIFGKSEKGVWRNALLKIRKAAVK